jgi:hypothetical protein
LARIYLSSTYADLKDYREAVYRQLTKLTGHQVTAMEDYVANDERPLAKCLADVAGCDLYVGIFAWRYGFVPKQDNPQNHSITELEYRHAKTNGKACLIFLVDEEAAWKRQFQDSVTKENDAGARIEALRKEVGDAHMVSFFDSPEQLAGLVSAAVQNWEKKPGAASAPAADSQPQFRELRNSILVAYAPQDEALARAYADLLASRQDKPLLLSPSALFAHDEAGFSTLENNAIQCAAGVVLLTPAALASLTDAGERVQRVLGMLRARLGGLATLLCGAAPSALPDGWGLDPVYALPAEAPDPTAPAPAEVAALNAWLKGVLPPWGSRTIGLPVCVLSMTADEHAKLVQDPGSIGDRLGNEVQKRFESLAQELAAAQIPWGQRYGATRDAWQPFGPGDMPVVQIVQDIADEINQRQLAKLRHRRIKVHWYPFDAVKAQYCDQDTSLRRVYKDVARAGCILVVDEVSLFHPFLNEAFRNSPFFNNEQVAMVTLSPFDPRGRAVDQLLESDPRRKLAGAFERYATEYDPQCELAVSDPRRLRRWLHASLPETVTNLREPRPDQEAMRAFFAAELGTDRRPRSGDYPWGGGTQT